MDKVAVYSKAVVVLLLIHCFVYLPLCEGVQCLVFILFYALLSALSCFAIIFMRKEELAALL